jgi:hypothetical protein
VGATTEPTSRIRRQNVPTVALKDSPNPNRALTVDGKKFLWDGRHFETYHDASLQAEAYKNDNFETHTVEDGGTYFVYTRRVVKEVVVTAP